FERRDIGLQLRVKPQISEGGVVRLAIYQELSSIQNTLTAAQGGIITNKRSFESSVLVEDGNIVVLGGLIEDRTDNSRSQVPLLGDIPFVGGLFRYENRGRRKTNLLVFLRPYVVRDENTSSALALDRYDYIRGQVAAGTVPDNLVFRDLQARQLPPSPAVPPSLRDRATSSPAATVPAVEPAPLPQAAADAGLGARTQRSESSAPIVDVPPAVVAPSPPPTAPISAAPAPIIVAPAVIPPAVVTAPAVTASAPIVDVPVVTVTEAPRVTAPPVSTPTPTPAPVLATPTTSSASAAVVPPAQSIPPTRPTPAARSAPADAPPVVAVASPTPPAPTITASSAPATQLLQVAAVSDIARGRDLQRQLRAAGMDAYWESVRTKQGGDIVRVRISVDTATQSVADAIAKLKAMGFDPIIVTP
ncbi:MAG: SPOR domain-containing protein, partial [Burkholderiaceae bacterium]